MRRFDVEIDWAAIAWMSVAAAVIGIATAISSYHQVAAQQPRPVEPPQAAIIGAVEDLISECRAFNDEDSEVQCLKTIEQVVEEMIEKGVDFEGEIDDKDLQVPE